MANIPKFEQLEKLTVDELKRRYDAAAANTVVGTGFYLDEIRRRHDSAVAHEALQSSLRAERSTDVMRRLTWVILAATLVNVGLVATTLL